MTGSVHPETKAADYVLVHECETPAITAEMEDAARRVVYGDAAGWWRCPECDSTHYLNRWYLGGVFHTMWSIHTRRYRRPKPQRRRWWRRVSTGSTE